jgi:hypothetical protein
MVMGFEKGNHQKGKARREKRRMAEISLFSMNEETKRW